MAGTSWGTRAVRTSLAIVAVALVGLGLLALDFEDSVPSAEAQGAGEASPGSDSGDPASTLPPEDESGAETTLLAPAPPEPAALLVEEILTRDPEDARELATGRFRLTFAESADLLASVDTSRLRPVRLGPEWVLAEAPVETTPGTAPAKAELRFSRHEGEWKLEHVRVFADR